MPFLKRMLSPFLCCFGVSPREEHATSDLQTLPSALHLPASQIPHAASQSRSNRTDRDALRDLFRSSSSIRGYRTASIPSGSHVQKSASFDNDFKFGLQEQQQKQPGRLEQLGNHIKQKLSESGLSKSSSRPQLSSEENGHGVLQKDSNHNDSSHLGITIPEFSLSQRSTGLLDLLQSRTASEGGYDSDAKSIQTAMLKSREGTMRLSPTRAQIHLPPTSALRHIAVDGAPPSPNAEPAEDDVPRTQVELDTLPSLQSETPLTKVLLDVKDESSLAVLQRLDAGGIDSTLKIPNSSSSVRVPASTAFEAAEQDPFTTSSPPRHNPTVLLRDTEFVGMLKKLGETVGFAKRESLISNGTDPRASLVSDLDPGLLEFISRYGESPSPNTAGITPDVTKDKLNPDFGLTVSSQAVRSSMSARENTSKKDLHSLAESERDSVHLYNMRISQRLGSPSFVATSTRPNTSHTTKHPLGQYSSDGRLSSDSTSVPGNIAGRIKTEHNRRPSDPQTRRLFEGDRNGSRPLSAWRNGASPVSSAADGKPKSPMGFEDASSFYWSDGEGERNGTSRHSTVKKNPNSIAIGGRSESISLPVGSSVGSLSVAEESAWFGRKPSQHDRGSEPGSIIERSAKRKRSASMPQGPTHRSRPSPALSGRREEHLTDAKGAMSVVSVDQEHDARREKMTEISVQAIYDARNEQTTEISAQAIQDARNERMSEIGPLERCDGTEARPELASFWSDAGPSALALRRSEHARRSVSGGREAVESALPTKPKFYETTTNVWQRSFKQALEVPPNESLGGFLPAPRFDREGRRRSTRSSISAIQLPQDRRGSDVDIEPLETRIQTGSPHLKDKSLLETCMRKPEPLPSVNPRCGIAIIDPRKEAFNTFGPDNSSRKKSLLDIGRRFSVIGSSGEAERASGTSTPLKELLGLWGRFPSHTREDRCNSAGAKDGVAVRDFAIECQDQNSPACSAGHARSNTALGAYTPGSWKMLSFGKKRRIVKRRTKSASPLDTIQTTNSLGLRPKRSRKGIAARWKKLYRTSSMEFQAYAHNYGHRSSISVGSRVEYPELEVVPGSPGWRLSSDGIMETANNHRREAAGCARDLLDQPLDTAPWTQTYRDCVGSLSALKSDPELRKANVDGEPGLLHHRHVTLGGTSSTDLRDSTVDFVSQLGKENEAAKEGLIRKVESMNPVQP